MIPRSAKQILVALISFLSTRALQGQELTRQFATLQIGALETPAPFVKMSSLRSQGYLNYDLQLRSCQFPVGNYWQFRPDRAPLMSRALWNQKASMEPNRRNAVTLVPAYWSTPSATHRTAAGTEHYLRHIPTAGPVIGRIYSETKAHPRITRALSMVRPDF